MNACATHGNGATASPVPAMLRHSLQLFFALALASITLGASATAALAFGPTQPCSGRAMLTPFARWADYSGYFLAPNGSFESGTTNWALSGGARVVYGNEPWKANGPNDTYSLAIPASGVAESRTLCVSMGEDTIRLFVNNPRVQGSILHVEAIVRNPNTGQVAQTAFDVNADAAPAGWSQTMRLQIPNLLGGNTTEELTVRFTVRSTPATWGIDDVFIDPYKTY